MRLTLASLTLAVAAALAATPVRAGPALLFEADSGRVLYAEDADDLWHPASVTKVMTAYLVFAALKSGKLTLEGKIKCSEAAHATEPSKVGLPVGAEMSVEMALKALIVKSANDVAVMLAEAISGSQEAFAAEMNKEAARLGMTRTRFVNPHGLPAPEQVTTARDLAHLARAVVRDHPEYGHFWAMGDMRIGKRRLVTHNALLRQYEGADGLKTGFTCDSGYNVVASATRDGRRLMAVVLGEHSGRDRSVRAEALLEHGFATSGWKAYFNAPVLAALPVSAEAKAAVSVRDEVTSWPCGARAKALAAARQRARIAKARAKAVAAQAARAAAKAAKAAEAAAKTPAGATAQAATVPAAAAAPAPAIAPQPTRSGAAEKGSQPSEKARPKAATPTKPVPAKSAKAPAPSPKAE